MSQQLSPEAVALMEHMANIMDVKMSKMEARLEARFSSNDESRRKTVGTNTGGEGMNISVVPASSSSATPEIAQVQSHLNENAKSLHVQHALGKEHPTSHEHHLALMKTLLEFVSKGDNVRATQIIKSELDKAEAAKQFGWSYVTTFFLLVEKKDTLAKPFGTYDSFKEVVKHAEVLGLTVEKPLAPKKEKSTPGKAASAKPAKANKSGGKKESFRKNDKPSGKPAGGKH